MAEATKWLERKATLVEKGLLHEIFGRLDHISFKANTDVDFEPTLIARHGQRLGELVDRCLSIRKDVRDLEVLAVKAATDYELFLATSKIDEEMEILRLLVDSKAREKSGFENAAAAFNEATTLEKGLAEVAQGRNAALDEDIKTSEELTQHIQQRWQYLRDYQNYYHDLHTERGNAHNYGERATLLLDVLNVLLKEALARATALATGIHLIYGVKLTDVPTSVTLQQVDGFAMWALRTIRSLAHASEQEVVSELVIPLVQPWLINQQPLVDKDVFNSAVSGTANGQPISLTFELLPNALLDSRARLKRIGLSFGNRFEMVAQSGIDRNQSADVFTRLAAKITTPDQMNEDGTTYRRPEVLVGNVGLHGVSAISSIEDSTVENLRPFGKWKITIHPFMVWKDEKSYNLSDPQNSDPIRDLKIALRFYIPGSFRPLPSEAGRVEIMSRPTVGQEASLGRLYEGFRGSSLPDNAVLTSLQLGKDAKDGPRWLEIGYRVVSTLELGEERELAVAFPPAHDGGGAPIHVPEACIVSTLRLGYHSLSVAYRPITHPPEVKLGGEVEGTGTKEPHDNGGGNKAGKDGCLITGFQWLKDPDGTLSLKLWYRQIDLGP